MSKSPKVSREITSVTRISCGTCIFNWKIEKIPSWIYVSCYADFSSVESCAFTSLLRNGYAVWKLMVGRDRTHRNRFVFHLLCIGVSSNVSVRTIKAKFSFLNAEDSKQWGTEASVNIADPKCNRYVLAAVGLDKLLRDYVYNERLSVRLEMDTYETPGFVQEISARFTADPKLKQVENRFHTLYDTQRFSDLVLLCEDEEFHVHKCILAARSSLFDAMLSHDIAEKNSNNVHLQISDVDSRTLKLMLRYMYTNEVNLSVPEEALKLYVAASKYKLPTLLMKCIQFFLSNLTIEVVIDVLSVACLHDDDILQELAANFIVSSNSRILETSKWENFTKEYPFTASKILENSNTLP